MTANKDPIDILVENEHIAGTFMAPESKMPGVLFVHGWGGSQERDLERAKGMAGLGCVCLTFDMRGHVATQVQKETVTREHNLADLLAAYDQLSEHPAVDPSCIAVIGTSYGGYLAAFLTTLRPVKWLALRVPALYWDDEWTTPKQALDKVRLMDYRHGRLTPNDNRALAACAGFEGDVLLVESQYDDRVPHSTIMSYRSSFVSAHSLTHRIIDGADHGLSGEGCQEVYTKILTRWVSEMVIGARVGT